MCLKIRCDGELKNFIKFSGNSTEPSICVGETAEVTLKLIGSVDKVFCCKKNAEKGRTVIVN
jgi:hypothetical protein